MFRFLCLIASLFTTTSAFGQCQIDVGYNGKAHLDLAFPWDLWVEGSLLYWQPIQDNMEPAARQGGNNHFSLVNLNFDYTPGFKVGLGMYYDFDDWDSFIAYTRLHGAYHKSETISEAEALAGAGYFPIWLQAIEVPSLLVTSFKAKWALHLDFLDVNIGRWYYVGTQLTFHPSLGIRANWIQQKRHGRYRNILESAFRGIDIELTDSWALGPRIGMDMNWMFDYNIRFFGNAALDLLYTYYKGTVQSQTTPFAALNSLRIQTTQTKINTFRTHADFEWGVGWGTCIDNWYLDLSASYGFQFFPDQNMFRRFHTPATMLGNSFIPNGNLYVHGLTVTAKLDF